MRVSIVTPCYNSAAYLERTLRSIHDQRGDFEIEHWVIDGGSTDGSLDILKRWSDRLQFVSEPDRGQSHAINKGFARATGEVIGWLNSDDLYLPGALAEAVDAFARRPETRWAYGKCHVIDPHDRIIRRGITWYKNALLRRYSYAKLLFEDYISQPAVFFRRDLLAEAGDLDEALHYAMDYDLWLRFGRIAAPAVIPRYLAAFRFHALTKTGGSYETSLREANGVVRKHAAAVGKAWIGSVNYWTYYKRTALVYRLLR